MIFVPLPLFASAALAAGLIWFVRHRDMALRPHQLFAVLLLAYGVQSVLLSLRWGYGIAALGPVIALLAPVLPVLAWLAYRSLAGQSGGLWPLGAVALCWGVLAVSRDSADIAILATYLLFGALLLRRARRGEEGLALSPVLELRPILIAMAVTGATLVLSGLMDVFVLVDFIRTGGANVGLAITLAQTLFVLLVGLGATLGHSTEASAAPTPEPPPAEAPDDSDDAEIIARVEALFQDGLHRDEDLSLRKLARRLGLPDRRVSNAINRQRGVNVSQFVNEHRIKDACDLLTATDQSVLHISMAVGFASKSNFNREFARVTGQTPSQWRDGC